MKQKDSRGPLALTNELLAFPQENDRLKPANCHAGLEGMKHQRFPVNHRSALNL
jgi:hypothetical protein